MFYLLLFGFRDGMAMLDKHYHHGSNAGYGPISRGVLAMPFVPIVDGEFLPTGHRIPLQMKISWDG